MTTTSTHEEWAVRVHGLDGVLRTTGITEDLDDAREALDWWKSNHPEIRPELVCREVVVQRGDWNALGTQPADVHDSVCTGPGIPAGFTCSHPSHARLAAEQTEETP